MSTLVALIVPVVVNWSYILQNFLFYDYFFGPQGVVTTLRDEAGLGSYSSGSSVLTQEQVSRHMSIIGGALVGALALGLAIKLIAKLIASASMTLKELTAVETPAKHEVEKEMGRRLTIRAVVLAVWILYTVVFVKAVLPFTILASQIGLSDGRTLTTGISYMLFAGLMLFATVHMHVIMLRLFMLRPRVFGGKDVIVGS